METLEEHHVKLAQVERKITHIGHQLLGVQNERRDIILQARKLELKDKDENTTFKLRYHHAVEDVKESDRNVEAATKAKKEAEKQQEATIEALTKLEEKSQEQLEQEEAIINERKLPIVQMGSVENDAWRELPLEKLNLSPAILEKLAAPILKKSDKKLGEVTTLGGLVDLTSGQQIAYSMLKGISSTTSGKIEDAWMEFWKSNPQHCRGGLEPATTPESSPPAETHDVQQLLTHGATEKAVQALSAGGYNQIEDLTGIIEDDDLLTDVVGKKAVKNVRLAYQSWRVMQ